MPPLVISPLLMVALGALGAGAVAHWVTKEVRRIGAELERVRTASAVDPTTRQAFPTLRRDPRTNEWRVM